MPVFEDIVHKALASGIRREIILALEGGPKYLSEIAKVVGKKPQTVDFHLTLLSEVSLVSGEWREGKKYWSLKNREILRFLKNRKPVPAGLHPKPPHEIMAEAWEDTRQRLDRIEKKLDRILKKEEADHLF